MSTSNISFVLWAKTPEDIFGDLTGTPRAKLLTLKTAFRRLRSSVAPDKNPQAVKDANDAAFKLRKFYQDACKLIEDDLYGKPRIMLSIQSKRATYNIHSRTLDSSKDEDWSESGMFFDATTDTGSAVTVKISKSTTCNAFMQSESKLLEGTDLFDTNTPVGLRARFPRIIESFVSKIDGVDRHVLVFEKFDDKFMSISSIKEKFDLTNEDKQLAWMLKRMLETAAFIADTGYSMLGFTPNSVLFNLDTHEVFIPDFTFMTKLQTKATAMSQTFASFYPPEILNADGVATSTDTYMIAKCIMYLVEGHKQLSWDKCITSQFANLLRAATFPNKTTRTIDAPTIYKRFNEMIYDRLHWPKKFEQFAAKKR